MRHGIVIAGRAAAQVVLVSASSVTLAAYQSTGGHGRLLAAAAIGFAISWVWWANTRAASLTTTLGGRWWYAGGAAIGTYIGAGLARWIVHP
jgi:ribosomal protein L18